MGDDERPSLRRGTWRMRRRTAADEAFDRALAEYFENDRRRREAIRAEGGGVVIPFRPRA